MFTILPNLGPFAMNSLYMSGSHKNIMTHFLLRKRWSRQFSLLFCTLYVQPLVDHKWINIGQRQINVEKESTTFKTYQNKFFQKIPNKSHPPGHVSTNKILCLSDPRCPEIINKKYFPDGAFVLVMARTNNIRNQS